MQKKRNNRGFSLAELLIVVAIVIVLSAVAFVAVQNHQKSMTQLEYDTIAKEIFVAAQNHLTAVESQGYPGLSPTIAEREANSEYGLQDGTFSENKEKDKVYYIAYPNPGTAKGMLELMLPFGAIDETIRAGGSYIIRYQPSSARVLDVFYSNKGHTAWLTTKGMDLPSSAFEDLMNNYRKTGIKEYQGALVGWYGNGDALPVGDRLEAPQVLIHNEETLWVEVTDPNTTAADGTPMNGALVLIVTGETSKVQKAFYLKGGTNSTDDSNRVSPSDSGQYKQYKIILDDITAVTGESGTQTLHFAKLEDVNGKKFIPGENITVEAIAYNNDALTNIAYSGKGRTNSLFADPSSYTPQATDSSDSTAETGSDDLKVNGTLVGSGIAAVTNIRHLENLYRDVSNWGGEAEEVEFSSAIQLTNLSWSTFADSTGGNICTIKDGKQTGEGNYLPVNLAQDFDYFGRNHIIRDVKTDGKLSGTAGNSGVFGTLAGGSVSNLLVLDALISGEKNSGALIGEMSGTQVIKCASATNKKPESSGTDDTKSTASVSGNIAGGLIGLSGGGTVTGCYSAGYTDQATYYTGGKPDYKTDETAVTGQPQKATNGIYNVEANGTDAAAGGLIGAAAGTTIESCYSTCSVKGATAGGLAGRLSGTASEKVSYCYATGLVSGSTEGAFAGTCSVTVEDCQYYQIINERKDEEKGFTYLDPVSENETFEGISALDKDAESYNTFVGTPADDWEVAVPYDETLGIYYQGKYPLKTVDRLGADVTATGDNPDLVATHYGDWPAPEIFVINTNS